MQTIRKMNTTHENEEYDPIQPVKNIFKDQLGHSRKGYTKTVPHLDVFWYCLNNMASQINLP